MAGDGAWSVDRRANDAGSCWSVAPLGLLERRTIHSVANFRLDDRAGSELEAVAEEYRARSPRSPLTDCAITVARGVRARFDLSSVCRARSSTNTRWLAEDGSVACGCVSRSDNSARWAKGPEAPVGDHTVNGAFRLFARLKLLKSRARGTGAGLWGSDSTEARSESMAAGR